MTNSFSSGISTPTPDQGTTTTPIGASQGAPIRVVRLEQAPCEWLDPLQVDSPSADVRCLAGKLEQLSRSIDRVVPQLNAVTQVDSDGHLGAWLSPHPLLTALDRQTLVDLAPVQSWLRTNLLKHNVESGQCEAPKSRELAHWRLDTLAWTQDLVTALEPSFKEIEVFLSGLNAWADTMIDAPPTGIDVPAEMKAWLLSCGVQVNGERITPTQWALLLASTAQRLEQRWLAASVTHQMAFMSYVRAELIGSLAGALEQKLGQVRQAVESDEDEPLPIELHWLDRARHDVLIAPWPDA
jgi:hypothetical protein